MPSCLSCGVAFSNRSSLAKHRPTCSPMFPSSSSQSPFTALLALLSNCWNFLWVLCYPGKGASFFSWAFCIAVVWPLTGYFLFNFTWAPIRCFLIIIGNAGKLIWGVYDQLGLFNEFVVVPGQANESGSNSTSNATINGTTMQSPTVRYAKTFAVATIDRFAAFCTDTLYGTTPV